jgi:L-fucose isomerase-like protein
MKDRQIASACEADLSALLAMRMLMSVSNKSSHMGNCDRSQRIQGAFRVNHSVPGLKINGFHQPDLPYQLGRFTNSGWGTKAVVDFLKNQEKMVTVARVNPSATKVLVLKGTLVGATGWGEDAIGCSVHADIQPPQGRFEEFDLRRAEYGGHMQWVFGDYTREMRQLGEMLKLEVEEIS